MRQIEQPMDSAPKDGTRILIRKTIWLFDFQSHKYQPSGSKWVECRWLETESRWVIWCGSESVSTTESVDAISWAPLPFSEDYQTNSVDARTIELPSQKRPDGHVLYRPLDKDIPDMAKDRNGHLWASMCRLCGEFEAGLETPCKAAEK